MKKRIYRMLVVGTAVAALVPLGASAATPGTQVSCLKFGARMTTATTTSTGWRNVPGMAASATLAQNFAVLVSGTFSGQGVRLRVLDSTVGGPLALQPGSTLVAPSPGVSNAVSFTWVGTNPAEHSHTFNLQWQLTSASGKAAIHDGSVTVLYQGAPTPTTC